MKKIKIITFAAMAAATAITFAGCGSGGSAETTASTESTEVTTSESTTAESENTESTSGENTTDTQESNSSADSSSDIGDPDIMIKDGDFEAMKTLASDISEGKMEGKVVEIEGYHSNNIRHSIMERDGNGTGVGFEFEVEGLAEEEYPAHDAKIKIVGVVKDSGTEALGMKVYRIYVPKVKFQFF